MENKKNEFKKYVEDMLDIAIEYNNLRGYLMSGVGYNFKVSDNQGNKVVAISAIMEAIYKKYTENNDSHIDKLLFATWKDSFTNSKNGETLLTMLSEVEYHLNAERNNTAPFKLDTVELLKILSNNIKENQELYQLSHEEYKNGFIERFEHHDTILEDYGHKIL